MIKTELKNNSLIIILNRAEKRNSLHPELILQLKTTLTMAEYNDEVKSVIITGDGSAFCAGADLEYLQQLSTNSLLANETDSVSLAGLFFQIYSFSKPTIAAVNGHAIAGGCGLASVCDLIVAHPENSKFGYSEVKIGFIPAIVSIFLLKRVSESYAKQLLLTGELINGKRAYEIGFANYLSDDVLFEALKISDQLNKNSALSISLTKGMINSISDMQLQSAIDFCINMNVISRSSGDFKKGIQKFLKKE